MSLPLSAERLRPQIAAKLYPPTLGTAQVARDRLLDMPRNAGPARLVLVHAPAGFGKTSFMVQYRNRLEREGVQTAWVTLDAADNDAARFLGCLALAVSRIGPSSTLPDNVRNGARQDAGSEVREARDGNAADVSEPPAGSLADMALSIMARLASHPAPFALLLDDAEAVHDTTVQSLVRELIARLPPHGRLVVGSRTLPELGLARLRARGQLLEIDAAHLRFTAEEARAFFTDCRRLPLPEDDLLELHRKTEGWPAGLCLAAAALDDPRDQQRCHESIARFSGTHAALAAYLAEQVLQRQPAPVRTFLLRTSILRDLDAAACDALLCRADSESMLQFLESANLFLTPHEGEERTWRYHSLFADFLRDELARETGPGLAALHARASGWYEERGRPVRAIDHALEAGDFGRALTLLTQHAGRMLSQGRLRLLSRWFAALPEDALAQAPLLQAIHVWALCCMRGPWDARALLERSACRDSADPRVQAYVRPLRLLLLCMMDRYEDAYEQGKRMLRATSSSDGFSNSMLANLLAHIQATIGRHHEALDLLDAARRCHGGDASLFNMMYSEALSGVLDLEAGRLRQAAARLRLAVRAAPAGAYRDTQGNAYAGILFAETLYEANELREAADLLQVYVPVVRDVGLADHMIKGYVLLARIAFCRGERDAAWRHLAELEYLGRLRQLRRVVASAKLERSRLHLLAGQRQEAREALLQADQEDVWHRASRLRLPAHDIDDYAIARLRWEIHFGDARAALRQAEEEADAATSAGRHRRACRLRILQSLAHARAGEPRSALMVMADALKPMNAEGYCRLILDEGELAAGIVVQLHDRLRSHGGDGVQPLFSQYLRRLLDGFGLPAGETDTPPAGARLTRSELQILSLVACGYSNIALSERLAISHSTVRTHLRTINGKLHTQSRSQAVAMARRLRMIQ